ncbi:hypothetical protein HanPI659440_Chr16g0620651 [Helianthus annuus]|nr:hypothetical protein HanPI659440_Chr16g0620651 [Helianthus annuus]
MKKMVLILTSILVSSFFMKKTEESFCEEEWETALRREFWNSIRQCEPLFGFNQGFIFREKVNADVAAVITI